nr:hypothetical protein [Clostridia bacterium]
MYTKSKKTAAGILALLMTTAALASCSDSGNAPAETTAADTTTAAVETTTAEIMPDLPNKDFGGRDFMFLTSGSADTNGVDWESYDFYAEAENGDVINDAVYERNMYISETYNITIKETKSTATTLAATQTAVLAGESIYDTVVTNLVSAATLAQNSQTYDMHELPYIDLTQPWWDSNLAENLSLAGRMNYATGDITVMDNDAIWVLMFNKQMMSDYGYDEVYGQVTDGEWYLDDFIEMSASVSADLNGDGKRTWQDDRFAFTTGPQTGITALYTSGLSLTGKDKDDLPVYSLDIERASAVAEKYGKMFTSNDWLISDSVTIMPADIRAMFEEGRALFFGEVLQCIQRMRASDTDFGVIPWPKFDELQDEYGTVAISNAAKCVTVPVTQADTEMVGIILEAMAAKSKYTLTPAYYELALTSTYMRDEESVAMLDIILDTMSMDLGYANSWANLPTLIRDAIKSNSGSLVSTIDANLPAFTAAMNKTVETFLASAK